MLRGSVWVALATMACAPGEQPHPFSVDLRLDAPGARDPESFGTALCAAANGTVYALWLDDRGDFGVLNLWMNVSFFHGDEGTWLDTPVRVNQGDPGTGIFSYDVSCDDHGVYAVWEEDRNTVGANHQIRFNQSVDLGASFFPDDRQLEVEVGQSVRPQIGGDGDALYVAWVEEGTDLMFTASDDSGDTWVFPFQVDGGSEAIGPFALAASEGGAAVVWEQAGEILAARAIPYGSTFPEALDSEPDVARITACADGADVHAVWEGRSPDAEGVWASASADGGADWAAAQALDATAAPSIGSGCAAAGGELQAVWGEEGAIELRAGGRAESLGAGVGYAASPVIARDPASGDLAVVWSEIGEGGFADLYYSDGGAALRLDSMFPMASHKIDLAAAVHSGAVLALWIDDRNGTSDVYFARLPLGTASSPPSLSE